MGQLVSIKNEKDMDDHVLQVYKKWMKCFYYCRERPVESINSILNTICISDKDYIQKHLNNTITMIRTPTDFVTCKIINLFSDRERIFSLRSWMYYKLRESNIKDEFILSDDAIENIAISEDNIFWIVLKIMNKLRPININKLKDVPFWTRMFILTGDSELLYKYTSINNINLHKYEKFREMYSPISESFIYTSLSETE